jgi:hypothetical protein
MTNGRAVVHGDHYLVFLTEQADLGGLYVASQGPHRFEVRARNTTASGPFSYRVVAKRRDIVRPRLEKVPVPPRPPESPSWAGRSSGRTPTCRRGRLGCRRARGPRGKSSVAGKIGAMTQGEGSSAARADGAAAPSALRRRGVSAFARLPPDLIHFVGSHGA